MVWRVALVVTTAISFGALLFAQLFGNLTALSSGFAKLRGTALGVGLIMFIVSGIIAFLTTRPKRVATVPTMSFLLTGTPTGETAAPTGTSLGLGRTKGTQRLIGTLIAGILVGWLGFSVVVYIMQDNLLFSPRGMSVSRLERIAREYPDAEAIEINAADGAVLRGWLLPPISERHMTGEPDNTSSAEARLLQANGNATPNPLMIVFAGQGGEASGYFDLVKRVPELAWAFVNYRGYGASDGTPSDVAMFEDATRVFDHLAARSDIDPDNIFALGGSLGTGVATYLASQRPVVGVILFSPYDRIAGGVTQNIMPWMPTKLLFRNRFDAVTHAPDIRVPVLAVIGNLDQVIRPVRSRSLLDHWGAEHRLIAIPQGDHFTIYEDDAAWQAVRNFVRDRME